MTHQNESSKMTKEFVIATCKIGQGHECCRYVACGANGFECLKHTNLKNLLDKRVESKTIIARADNCEGFLK